MILCNLIFFNLIFLFTILSICQISITDYNNFHLSLPNTYSSNIIIDSPTCNMTICKDIIINCKEICKCNPDFCYCCPPCISCMNGTDWFDCCGCFGLC